MAGHTLSSRAMRRIGSAVRAQEGMDGAFARPPGAIVAPGARGWWFGTVADKGPDDEANYTDHRYWVTSCRCSNDSTDMTEAVTVSDRDTADPDVRTETVTNVAEQEAETHLLQVGQPVQVWPVYDRQDPKRVRWVMFCWIGEAT